MYCTKVLKNKKIKNNFKKIINKNTSHTEI